MLESLLTLTSKPFRHSSSGGSSTSIWWLLLWVVLVLAALFVFAKLRKKK